MTFDADLATRHLDYLETHPEKHRQETYGVRTACGTKFCLAGNIAAEAEADGVVELEWTGAPDEAELRDLLVLSSATYRGVSEFAADQLGLDAHTASILFASMNTIADMREMVEWLRTHDDLDGCPAGQRVLADWRNDADDD